MSNPEAPKDRDWLGDTFEQANSLTNDLPRWAQPVVTGSSASSISIEPDGWESYCHLCLGPNIDWSAPSPLWNQVMRGGSINGDEIHDGVVCPTCFATLAEQAGVATFWRLSATNVHVELETVTPSGRVWDDRIWMWVEPAEMEAVIAVSEDDWPVPISAQPDVPMPTSAVLLEIAQERIRQLAKWSEQNHPDGTGRPGSRELSDHYRVVCKANDQRSANWQDILTEEVYEAFAETEPLALRAELVQSAAVIVAWIEAIDRRLAAEIMATLSAP